MSAPTLLDHLPVQRALTNPATRTWLRDMLTSAAERDPVDVLDDLDEARSLVHSYFQMLARLHVPILAQEKPDGR